MENQNLSIAKKLNDSVGNVLSSTDLQGFEKAYLIASAAGELKKLLTAEYMKPIMDLQGNKLGFKTDKDDKGGYPEPIVKNCLIEAVLTGVQPFGNQFNIIANNCYITKEGFGYLLKNLPGLKYDIVPALPRISQDKTSAAIDMTISWSINGSEKKSQILPVPVKMNAFMGTDAVIGKATRKARAWLYNTITGSEVSDGDIADVEGKIVDITPNQNIAEEKENDRVTEFIKKATTKKQLEEAANSITTTEQQDLVNQKMGELK